MNRRSIGLGMRVAMVRTKYSQPERAVIRRVDRSEGYGASHTIVLCDDDWKPRFRTDGSELTLLVTSRQIKDWNEVEAGVEEAAFLATKNRIAAELATKQREQAHEPWEQLANTLALLCGGDEGVSVEPYGVTMYRITINKMAWDTFLDLLLPHLTQRLFERSFGRPATNDDVL